MRTLTQNVINILGENGQMWLDNLPNTIAILAKHWNLSNIIPVANMTYNYVAKALQSDNQPVVLKIGFDVKVITDEKKALEYFDGNASIKLINYHEAHNTLLLQQAIPGISLKALYPANAELVMDYYVATMQKLLSRPLPKEHNFRHIRDWLQALDRIKLGELPQNLLTKAIQLKNALLASQTKEILLHGDLHHDNILQDQDAWLAIDPKGIIGEPEFEIAAFDFIRNTEWTNNSQIKQLFLSRIAVMATKANLDAERIKKWIFVRSMLGAAWVIEDNGDPGWFIKLAQIIYDDQR